MRKDIKQLVNYYVKKFNTRNPYDLAQYLNVEVQIGSLGSRAGCYMFLKNHKCIFLNEELEENAQPQPLAAEDGEQNIEEDVPPFYDAMAEEYAAYEEEEAKQQAAASNFLDEFPE